MSTPTAALSWQVFGQHRWGLAGVVAAMFGLAIAFHQAPPSFATSTLAPLVTVLPLSFVYVYLAYVFTLAEFGPRPRLSSFPPWMFTLPVPTWRLVLFPMLYGAVTMALSWLAAREALPALLRGEVPLAWPAVGLAATLAWLQAVDWWPVGLFPKAIIAGLALAGTWAGLLSRLPEEGRLGLGTAALLAGYGFAVLGVNRARLGEQGLGLRWRWPARLGKRLPLEQHTFASPLRALCWLEWRRNGLLLPGSAAIWLFLVVVIAGLEGRQGASHALVMSIIYLLPLTAPLMGGFLGKPEVWSRQFRLSTYDASRPVPAADFVLAKLAGIAFGLLLAYGVLVGATLLWALVPGNGDLVWQYVGQAFRVPEADGPGSAFSPALMLLCVVGFFGFAFFQLAGHATFGMTGRVWLVVAVLFFYLVGVPNLIVARHALLEGHRYWHATIDEWLPRVVRGWVVLKFLAAVAAFRLACRVHGMTGRTLAVLVGLWLLVAGCLTQLVLWPQAPDGRLSVVDVFPWVALFLPLVRVAAAPSAFAWNRHR